MKRLAMTGAAIALMMGTQASAAQFLFDFATNQVIFGSPVSGSGTITTADTPMMVGGRTALQVIGISGTFNGSAITGGGAFGFGNYFVSGPTFVDGSGIRFDTTSTTNVSLFFDSNAQRYRVNAINQGGSSFVTATSSAVAAAVPEPATWLMMIVGFGAIGWGLRRRPARVAAMRTA